MLCLARTQTLSLPILAQESGQRQNFCPSLGSVWRFMTDLCVLAAGSEETLNRPCVDCGLVTGNFCDGIVEECFAALRLPSQEWATGQRTPLCSVCESNSQVCHYCRGVPHCTPFTHTARDR